MICSSYIKVLNEDFIKAKNGFNTHKHENYEIFTYMISGELQHRDSMDNVEIVKRGDVQFTSAGSGIEHSEQNRHSSKQVHLLQIWITPSQSGLTPLYTTKFFAEEEKQDKLCLLVGPKGLIKINTRSQKIGKFIFMLHGVYAFNFCEMTSK